MSALGGFVSGVSGGLGNFMSGGSRLSKLFAKKKSSSGSDAGSGPDGEQATFHKGGKVKKTGKYRLKKGERVLTKGQQRKLLKRKGK
jgi:hypothetical protein